MVRLFIVPVSLTRQGCTSLSNPSVQRLLQIKFSGAEKSCRPRWNSLPDFCDSHRDTGRPLYQENQNMGTGWVASCPGKNKGIKSPSLRVWSIKMYQNRLPICLSLSRLHAIVPTIKKIVKTKYIKNKENWCDVKKMTTNTYSTNHEHQCIKLVYNMGSSLH